MANVSRPLIALLVTTVVFLAVWVTALRPSTSGSGKPSGLGQYQSAINKAKHAVGTANKAAVAQGGTIATQTQAAPRTATVSHAAAKPAPTPRPVAHKATPAAQRRNVVVRALAANKVVAVLFYNPAAADDRAVKQELATVPSHGGKVIKLAVPLAEILHYQFITNKVPVDTSPTLVLVNRRRQATTIVGFADRFEIEQRVADALS